MLSSVKKIKSFQLTLLQTKARCPHRLSQTHFFRCSFGGTNSRSKYSWNYPRALSLLSLSLTSSAVIGFVAQTDAFCPLSAHTIPTKDPKYHIQPSHRPKIVHGVRSLPNVFVSKEREVEDVKKVCRMLVNGWENVDIDWKNQSQEVSALLSLGGEVAHTSGDLEMQVNEAKGEWLHVKVVQGGITNRLYKVTRVEKTTERVDLEKNKDLPWNIPDACPRSVLVRVYGDNTEVLINR